MRGREYNPLGLSPESGEPEGEEERKKQSRRDFLKRAALGGAGVLGAAGVFGLGSKLLRKKEVPGPEPAPEEVPAPEPEITEDNKVYKNGEYFQTEACRVTVDGWKLVFHRPGMAFFAWSGYDKGLAGYSFHTKGPDGSQQAFLRQYFNHDREPVSSQPENLTHRTGNDHFYLYSLPDMKDPSLQLELRIYDSGQGSLIEQIFRQPGVKAKVEPKPTKIYRYKIGNEINVYPPQSRDDFPRVASESKLDSQAMSKIHNLHRLFSEYKKAASVYVLDGSEDWVRNTRRRKDPADRYNPLYENIIIASKNFTKPEYEKEGEQTALHEIAHSVARNAKFEGPEGEAWKSLEELHKKLNDISGGFSVFTESNYLKRLDSKKEGVANFGHPWDNTQELFASVMTVLRYHADEFARRYQKLDPGLQQYIKETVSTTLQLLRAMNPSEDTLKRLLPELETLRSKLGL